MSYEISHLRVLESEAVHVIREVAAELERGVLLFSGGKDSAVLLHLARKAFRPAALPFPVMHVDTGHNFPEVIEYRDRMVEELGAQLIVASVQESIDNGRVVEEKGPRASRNRLQSVTLLDAIEKHGFKAAFGGARRDEERARAKERILSFRDDFGQWDPKAQRPELWNLYNGHVKPGEHVRVFPLSNWTELDVWQYIREEQHRAALDLLRPQARGVQARRHAVRDLRLRRAAARRGAVRGVGALPHRGRHELHRRRGSDGRDARGRGAPRSPPRASPSAARRAPTTASPRPPWRTARRRATSSDLAVPGAATNGRPLAARRSELVRFATAGSVDDGKSTLIGRLLYDTKSIFEDQLEHVEQTSKRRGDSYVNLALLTDGLRAEREQGITIDVAYRYFHTPRRKFIIADTPGHEQYTRNMVTGASTADLALILVDARKGVLEQSRRHAFIASLLRIPHLVVCVNKMDLVDFDQEVFDRISAEFTGWAAKLDIHDMSFIPISALHGDNVVERSEHMPWYEGPSLLYHLEHVHVASDRNLAGRPLPGPVGDAPDVRRAPRLPRLRRRDRLGRFPRRRRGGGAAVGPLVAIAGIDTYDGVLDEAFPPLSVTLRLEDDIDISRGDMICRPHNRPAEVARARRDGLLDVRAPAAAVRPLPHQAHDAHGCSPRSTSCATAST